MAARTPLGAEADGYMREGKLVPDALVLSILKERLAQPDAQRGFVLDGYPRTLAQAEALARITSIDAAAWFQLSSAELVRRLAGRRICPGCHRVYNVETRPPRSPGVCDDDGRLLLQRSDDRPEAVAERLKVYERETAPLLEHFRAQRLLRPVDASGTPEAVATRLTQLFGKAPAR